MIEFQGQMKGERLRTGHTVLQGLVAFAIGVLFCFPLLGKVAFAVARYFPHVTKIILVIVGWIFFGILLQDLNDLAAAVTFCEMIYR